MTCIDLTIIVIAKNIVHLGNALLQKRLKYFFLTILHTKLVENVHGLCHETENWAQVHPASTDHP